MNIFFKAIQKSFDLLDQGKTRKSSFMAALEYMLKIADQSEYEVERCDITADANGDMVIMLKTGQAQLTITATSLISYMGTGPKEEDRIRVINTYIYAVSDEVFQWIKRNRSEKKGWVVQEKTGRYLCLFL